MWWGRDQQESSEIPSLLYSIGSFLTPDPQVKPRQGLQCAKGKWYQQSLCKLLILHTVSAHSLLPAHFSALLSRRHLEFGEWCPQIQAPPKWGAELLLLQSTPCKLLSGDSSLLLCPQGPVWVQAVSLNCFHTVSIVRAQKMLFFVLHARYCQKRILSRFFLLMFCRGILDHQASQEQRDPKVMR